MDFRLRIEIVRDDEVIRLQEDVALWLRLRALGEHRERVEARWVGRLGWLVEGWKGIEVLPIVDHIAAGPGAATTTTRRGGTAATYLPAAAEATISPLRCFFAAGSSSGGGGASGGRSSAKR